MFRKRGGTRNARTGGWRSNTNSSRFSFFFITSHATISSPSPSQGSGTWRYMLLGLVSASSFKPMNSCCLLKWLRSLMARCPDVSSPVQKLLNYNGCCALMDSTFYVPPVWRHLLKLRRSCTERSPLPRPCCDAPPEWTAAESPAYTCKHRNNDTQL